MIIRILNEGQFDVPDDHLEALNELDDSLERAIEGNDEEAFGATLAALLDRVRELGEPVALDSLQPSQLLLPASTASLSEVRDLLSGEGLIPG